MIPQNKQICQGKMYLPKSKTTPKNNMYPKKNILLFFAYLIDKACQILSTFPKQCHCLHLYNLGLHLPYTHSYNTPKLFTAIPHHHYVPSTALDIHHFLKPFTVTSGEMHCHVVMIHTG